MTLTSSGAAATASVGGSPYDIVASAAVGTGLANYTITYIDGELTVEAKALTITADDLTKTYGDFIMFAGTEFSTSGLVNADTVDSVTLTSSGAAATASVGGSPYDIVASAAVGTGLANYTITYIDGELTVEAKALTITADDLTKTYGDSITFAGTEFSTSGLVNADTVDSVTLTSSGAAATASVGGSPYDIVASAAVGTGLANYTITYIDGELTVTKADAVIVVTGYTGVYDGASHGATGSATGVLGEDLSGDLDLGASFTNVPGGPATWTFTDSTGNYNDDDGMVAIVITKAPTMTTVTFEAGPYIYRGTAFTATANVTGAGGLNEAVTVTYSGDCLNVTSTNGCTASATFLGDANHSGSTDSQSITITQRPITVTAVADTKIYDGTTSSSQTPGITSGTLAGSDTPNFSQTFDTPDADTGKTMIPAGTVNDGNGGANYAVTFVNVNTGTITQASTTTVPADVTATYNVNDQTLTLTATVTAGVPIVNESTVTFTVKDGTNTTIINVPVTSGTVSGGSATASYNLLGGTSAGLYKINAHFNASTNFFASDGIANLLVTPGALLADVSTSDSEFKNLDAFDVLFAKSKLGSAYAVLKNTKPGTFHYELTITNETGTTIHKKGVKLPPKYVNNIAVNDTNGGSASVFLTVPALPIDVKTPIPASANGLKDPAFILSGKKAIKVQKEDKSDMDGITIKWLASISAPYTECPQVPDPATGSAWNSSALPDGAAIKCIKIDGFEIPKHGKAKVDVSYDFRLKDTDGWLSTAQQKFLAGFAFKSTTRRDARRRLR